MAQGHRAPNYVMGVIGRRVRMTFFQRDNSTHRQFGIEIGARGPFDIDRIVEGTMQLVQTIHVPSPAPALYQGTERVDLYAVVQDDGTEVYGIPRLTSDAELNHQEHTGESSRFDGHRSGDWLIELLG
ncbi:MAG: hypothetical protein ABFD50_04640 [Smithella sp.]